jgi:hypothetical protein
VQRIAGIQEISVQEAFVGAGPAQRNKKCKEIRNSCAFIHNKKMSLTDAKKVVRGLPYFETSDMMMKVQIAGKNWWWLNDIGKRFVRC